MKPLAGVRVLDFSRYIAGPYCATLLAQFGAEVIKIETPGVGDECRTWPPLKNGESGYFASMNRGKKSLTLNIKSPEGKKIVAQLVKESSVLLHNFTAGVCKKLEMDYETISRLNPQIIYCSVSGFGAEGPYRDRKGFDTIFQAMGGITGLTGEENGEPVKAGVPIADVSSGIFSALSIITALYNRTNTGKGECIDIALLDSVLNFLPVALSFYSINGEPPRKMGSQHPGRVPSAAFKCADGKYAHISVTDAQWKSLCEVLNLQDLLADERFALNENRVEMRQTVMEILSKAIARVTRKELVSKCLSKGIPCGEIMTLDEIEQDEHIVFRKSIGEYETPGIGRMKYARYPARFKEIDTELQRFTPRVGEDTDEVLTAILNYSPDELKILREKGVI